MKSFKELEPGIKIMPEKKFIGRRMKMSFSLDTTHELWLSFMPGRKI